MSLEIIGNTIGGTSGDLGIAQTEDFATSPTTRGWVETTGSPTYGGTGAVFSGTGGFVLAMDTISAKEFFCMTLRTVGTATHSIVLQADGSDLSGINETSDFGSASVCFSVTAVNLHNGTWQIQYAGVRCHTGGANFTGIYDVTTKNLDGAIKFGVRTSNSYGGDIILIGASWL